MRERNKDGTYKKGSGVSGEQHNRYRHGMARTVEYKIWANIKARCYYPKSGSYKLYGEKGITMSEEWKNDFVKFYEDMGDRPSPEHSIDRIDNSKGYSKENCRWADKYEQANNKSSVPKFLYKGKYLNRSDIAKLAGITKAAVYLRINKGMSVEEIINTPAQPGKRLARRNITTNMGVS